jgi:hypothetical protein
MTSRYPEADLTKLRRVSIEERGGLIRVEDFVRPGEQTPDFRNILGVIPDLFAGSDLRRAVAAIADAHAGGGTVLVMFGAHVVKCGLSRLLIDLMERRVVTAVSTNGAGAIHDFEIALWGMTSEDVAANLSDGTFGLCRETADEMNECADRARREELGLGEALGRELAARGAPHLDASILGRAYELDVPVTVHVGIGTDIVHQHASADGAAIGDASLRDFRILAGVLGSIEGGVAVNIGSAVILPEVFLKALAVARNLGGGSGPFTAVNLDMNEPYRAVANVLCRPTAEHGMAIALRGRHEFLLPLLWGALRGATEGPGAAR